MINYIIPVFVFITILIFIINYLLNVSTLLYLLNCNYDYYKPINICTANKLTIVSHDFEHIDLIILFHELEKQTIKTVVVVYDCWWNKLFDHYIHNFGKNQHIEFLFVGKEKNNTNKIADSLNNGKDVLIFLYRDNPSKGIYYIIRDTNVPIYITPFSEKRFCEDETKFS